MRAAVVSESVAADPVTSELCALGCPVIRGHGNEVIARHGEAKTPNEPPASQVMKRNLPVVEALARGDPVIVRPVAGAGVDVLDQIIDELDHIESRLHPLVVRKHVLWVVAQIGEHLLKRDAVPVRRAATQGRPS